MLEKGRITSFQLFCLMYNFLLGSSVLTQFITMAGRDTWVSAILAVFAGASMVLLTITLASKFPNMTLIEYAQVLLGKTFGKIIGVCYLWYFLHLGALVLRNFGAFLSGEVMPETPIWFFHLTLVLVVVMLIHSGLEVAGRLSELVFPAIALTIITVSTLIGFSGIIDLKNFLPFLENGAINVIKGAVPIAAFPYQELILFSMVFPFVNTVPSRRKAALWAVFVGAAFLLLIRLQIIATFGENTAALAFPRFAQVRLISVGMFIERIDAVVLAVWIMGGLVKVGVCLFAFVLGLAQILGLKNYKLFILPSAALMVVLSLLIFENTWEMFEFRTNIYPIYAFPLQVVFPLLMLFLARRKKSIGRPSA